jgi:hypothetical protein
MRRRFVMRNLFDLPASLPIVTSGRISSRLTQLQFEDYTPPAALNAFTLSF